MNCADCQSQIFDGELDRNAVVHLAECDDCRALDREVRLNTAALAELREEAIPVRAARPRWPWVAAMAAAAAIVAIVLWPTHPDPVPAPTKLPVVTAAVTPPHVLPVLPTAVPAPHRVKHVRPKPKAPSVPSEPPAQQLMVKFFTDDPDIVIYWLIDPPKGEVGL